MKNIYILTLALTSASLCSPSLSANDAPSVEALPDITFDEVRQRVEALIQANNGNIAAAFEQTLTALKLATPQSKEHEVLGHAGMILVGYQLSQDFAQIVSTKPDFKPTEAEIHAFIDDTITSVMQDKLPENVLHLLPNIPKHLTAPAFEHLKNVVVADFLKAISTREATTPAPQNPGK